MVVPIIETKQGGDKVALIKYAIENKYTVKFFYTGEKVKDPNEPKYTKKGYRWVQPVALGVSPKPDENGNYNRLLLRGWQTGMGVTNTKKPEWKTFLVDEMSGVMVFDSSDSSWFAPFNKPDGYNLNTTGDGKFKSGQSLAHININTPPGQDHKKVYKKMPKKKTVNPVAPVQPDVTVEPTAISADKPKVFKKKPRISTMAAKKKLKDIPAKTGPKKPIGKPEDEDSIDSQIIPTQKGNQRNNTTQTPEIKPDDKNKQEPPMGPEEDLHESFKRGKEWLVKFLENER